MGAQALQGDPIAKRTQGIGTRAAADIWNGMAEPEAPGWDLL
jgi:hypothetical protein